MELNFKMLINKRSHKIKCKNEFCNYIYYLTFQIMRLPLKFRRWNRVPLQ